jgi:hypothetical protein
MLQDVRYGWRQLRREKGFTLVVVLSLALGIGANTAIFTLTNAVMIKRLPVMDPDQLVLLNWTAAKGLSVIQTGRSGRDSAGAYLPYTQSPVAVGSMHVEVRTAGEPLALLPSIRQAVQSLEPTLPLTDVTTQALQIERTLSQEHLLAKLSSVFGFLALLLACIGLYGTLAYAVSTRHNEIGVRIALGATRGTIVGMFLRQAQVLVGAGAVVGIIGGLLSTKLVGAMLYGLSPTDPATIASAAVLLVAITGLAAYLPAYRASRVDPVTVLRRE